MGNNNNIVALFAKAAFEVNGKSFNNLTPSTVIASLGMDSVAIMELVGFLEEQLGLRLPDEDLALVQTLADLEALIQRIQGETPLPA
ncbi:MAG: acyl carrier protein [Cystobacterineae bacterium]|nr:acyl carrier protein [Cystobacterineae bacterium]